MQILINNSGYQTLLFGIVLICFFLFTLRKKTDFNSLAISQELKGFAILTVIFAHIGYFLSVDTEFLFPFSIFAGVGVNIFLFLSGYGLTISKSNKSESFIQFFKRRLSKLFIPFWIVLSTFVLLDYFVLNIEYSKNFIFKAFFGVFTHSRIFEDLNSPLWYFSLILFYYILFQIFYIKNNPWITAVIIFLMSKYFISLDLETFWSVIGLYQVHTLAFPLGIIFAQLVLSKNKILNRITELYKKYEKILYFLFIPILIFGIGYLAINSGVGESANKEQVISVVSMFLIIILFLIKKTESKFLAILGLYSFEIYLLHWPILYRYDFLYKNIPAWLATFVYLFLFILMGFLLKKVVPLIKPTK